MLVVDLGELEGGARAIAFALGARHIGIVELALEPAARGERAPLAGLDPNLEIALARARASPCPLPRAVPDPSSRIICTSMPSRSPRSATRSRSHGNARRIASRMAQPASTRSARSRADAGIGDALLVAHREQLLDHAGDLTVAHPAAVDLAAVVALQPEMDAGDRGHGARRAEHVHVGVGRSPCVGREAASRTPRPRRSWSRTGRGRPACRRGARPA